jgi:hypothetical protein
MEPNKNIVSFDFENPSTKPIDLQLDFRVVESEIRRLNVTWSPELAQDLEAYHNIDAEEELTALLSQEIAREIDTEIMGRLFHMDIGYTSEDLDPLMPRYNLPRLFLVEPETPIIDLPLMPMVNRVAARTLANDLVNVQPTELPRMNLFYFDPISEEDPVVLDSGSWYMGDTFESDFIIFKNKRHKLKDDLNPRLRRRLDNYLSETELNRLSKDLGVFIHHGPR